MAGIALSSIDGRYANMIETVGCENVHVRCDSTDVDFVLSNYSDGSHDL